jgi:hypothetical protein
LCLARARWAFNQNWLAQSVSQIDHTCDAIIGEVIFFF